MKTIKSGSLLALSMAAVFGLSSCNSDSEPTVQPNIISFESLSDDFNDNNVWTGCYDVNIGAVKAGGFAFSHTANATEWDGVIYESWKGFCPSRVNDGNDHGSDWTPYQWAATAPNPMNATFLVGNSEADVKSNPLDNTTCSLQMTSNGYFKPAFVYVCNSSYTYYVAKNGNAFCQPFTSDDEMTLNIVGVRDGVMTAHLKLYLARYGMYLNSWTGVSLEQLGTVDKVLFYVDSTSKGAYGLNVPAYFCIADFGYTLPDAGAK